MKNNKTSEQLPNEIDTGSQFLSDTSEESVEILNGPDLSSKNVSEDVNDTKS